MLLNSLQKIFTLSSIEERKFRFKKSSQGHSTGIFGVNLNVSKEGFEGGEQLNVEQNHE